MALPAPPPPLPPRGSQSAFEIPSCCINILRITVSSGIGFPSRRLRFAYGELNVIDGNGPP